MADKEIVIIPHQAIGDYLLANNVLIKQIVDIAEEEEPRCHDHG